ncbi:unnamed protein product [Prorocentrum cordatum]|uniref:Uncharacterized protein n=1 Tax=Prorocentrum cordatum TaxID=2364126 RepID=A0ABN9QJM3_9DINO|nr:unnamed protein product [Polarella glacialis]
MMTKKEKRKMNAKNVGFETCQECPATLRLSAPSPNLTGLGGMYRKTTITSKKFNGGRPIYVNMDSNIEGGAPVYLFFMQDKLAWSIGLDYSANFVMGYAAMEAQCPRDTKYWLFHNGQEFVRKHFDIKGERNGQDAPQGTEHISWNMQTRSWEREKVVWESGRGLATLSDDDDVSSGGDNATTARSEEGSNATENGQTGVENGATDSVGEGDRNATEKEGADAVENEKTGRGEAGETDGIEEPM